MDNTKSKVYEYLNTLDYKSIKATAKFVNDHFVVSKFTQKEDVLKPVHYVTIADLVPTDTIMTKENIISEFIKSIDNIKFDVVTVSSSYDYCCECGENNNSYLTFYVSDGVVDETFTKTLARIKGCVADYIKDKKEYNKYLELKSKFEPLG